MESCVAVSVVLGGAHFQCLQQTYYACAGSEPLADFGLPPVTG